MNVTIQQQLEKSMKSCLKYECVHCKRVVYLDSWKANGRAYYCPYCHRQFRAWTEGFSLLKYLFPGDETFAPSTALRPSYFLRKLCPRPPILPDFKDNYRIPTSEWIRAGESDDPAGYMENWYSPNCRQRLKSYRDAVVDWKKRLDVWLSCVEEWNSDHADDKIDTEDLPREEKIPEYILKKYGDS